MKTKTLVPFALLLAVTQAHAHNNPAPVTSPAAEQPRPATPADNLADAISAVATSNLPTADKQKKIEILVRTALAHATNGVTDPATLIELASALTAAAVQAAPDFATLISQTVLATPALSPLPTATASIEAAVKEGLQAANVRVAGFDASTDTTVKNTHKFSGDTSDAVVSSSR